MYSLMIVDDSNIIRNRIERTVKGKEFEVVATAFDGSDAVSKFKQHRPDVITMDLTMPNMDGLECIREINAIDSEACILVVSALSDKLTGLLALEYGARGFLCKPFTDDQLNEALEQIAAFAKGKKK